MKPTYVVIAGEPATGKSTVVKSVIKALRQAYGKPRKVKMRAAEGIYFEDGGTLVLGRYGAREGMFPGTDRLSMAAQPDCVRLLGWLRDHRSIRACLVEGDRLYNLSMLDAVSDAGWEIEHLALDVPSRIIEWRHQYREDTQREAFIKGRRTKLGNVSRKYPPIYLANETWADLRKILQRVKSKLGVPDVATERLAGGG